MGRQAVIGEVEAVTEEIRKVLLAVPELSSWPAAVQVIERPVQRDELHCWDYPVLACKAVGGTSAEAIPGAAAVFCLLHSIHLVDDMLDEDPRGSHLELGLGRAANLALALQAAAAGLFGQAALPAERYAAVLTEVTRISLATAYGQELDAGEMACEEDYWRVVAHKTPPLFAGALAIGALLGGASFQTVEQVREVGSLLGRLLQVSDDIKDSLARPAEVDWLRPCSNLAILYALSAEHPLRDRFKGLLPILFTDPSALTEAQDILVGSGAVSFCVYHIVETFRTARSCLSCVDLHSSEPLAALLSYYLLPVRKLFKTIEIELPEDLIRD